jgi:hypothetical protein
MEKKEPQRFLSIRLTPAEYKEIHRRCVASGCRSLTEYMKKVLMNKLVTIETCKESIDEMLHCIIGIKSRLEILEEALDEKIDEQLRLDMAEIKDCTRQFYEKWAQL